MANADTSILAGDNASKSLVQCGMSLNKSCISNVV